MEFENKIENIFWFLVYHEERNILNSFLVDSPLLYPLENTRKR